MPGIFICIGCCGDDDGEGVDCGIGICMPGMFVSIF